MVKQNYQCVQNHKTQLTSKIHNPKCDGDVTMLKHVFINLNPCCVQWYKFHVHRGKGSGDTVTHKFTHLYQNHETWLNSWAHSSISDGDVTILLHTLTNFHPCCIQQYNSHVHRSQGSGDTVAQSYPCAPKPQNMVNFMGLQLQI